MTPWDIAKTRLARMTAATAEPQLSSDELDELLTSYRMTDKNGKSPTDDEWTATFNLNKAAAEGWRWKAAKASELISVDLDGERMSSNQVFAHCQEMIRMYSRKNSGTIGVTTQ